MLGVGFVFGSKLVLVFVFTLVLVSVAPGGAIAAIFIAFCSTSQLLA